MTRLPGLKQIRLGMQWLRGRIGAAGLILGYHRVAVSPYDPFGLCVQPQHLAEQLEIIAQYATPISLEGMWAGLQAGTLPRRAIAVTFDDGYAEVLAAAAPLLAHHNIPATVFVTTGSLGHPFWWDELTYLILASPCLPDSLELSIKGDSVRWSVTHPRYLSLNKDTDSPRRNLLHTLYNHLVPLSLDERNLLLAELRQWTGCTSSPRERSLTPDEIITLNQHQLISLGAHTVTHPWLPHLPAAAQQAEIQGSKHTLETVLGQPVTLFSYPHGQANQDTRRWVGQAGFALACASENGVVWRGRDPYFLPRFWIPDWDGETFARWLKQWLG